MALLEKLNYPIKSTRFGSRSLPVALLVGCAMAYGLLLPQMGFYWDDWPCMWLAQILGRTYLLKIDQAFRPLAGVILWLCSLIAGQRPFTWQLLSLLFRWIGTWTLFFTLTSLWPDHKERAAWTALLFLVYPGYGHQFVAVNSSRHLLPLVFYFLSNGLMVQAIKDRRIRRFWLHGIALGLATLEMLSTDYYYGLELLRPLILWLAVADKTSNSERLKKGFRAWIPYLILLVSLYAWRYTISKQVNYGIILPEMLSTDLPGTVRFSLQALFQQITTSTLDAWKSTLEFPIAEIFGPKKTLLFWGLEAVSSLSTMVYLLLWRKDAPSKNLGGNLILLGLAGLLVGGVPFLVTGLMMKVTFPSNRLTLPMAFGASLLLVGLIDLLGWNRPVKISLIALAMGLAVGIQFQTSASFARDWNYQQDFFRQLTWRVPGLKSDTVILTSELRETHSTDDSLTSPLNWIYFPDNRPPKLLVGLGYLEVRLGGWISGLEKGLPILYKYGPFLFHSSTDHSLVIYYAPPACLRVLHPIFDANYPHLPDLLASAVPLSNLDQIVTAPILPTSLPQNLFGPEPKAGWCYYFEKADLARQLGDWNEVVRLGKLAFQTGYAPNHASERAPFIQGYAYTGDWERATALTLEAININKFMGPMLCSLWQNISQNTPETDRKVATIKKVSQRLGCGLP